jgi:hypothetical protein
LGRHPKPNPQRYPTYTSQAGDPTLDLPLSQRAERQPHKTVPIAIREKVAAIRQQQARNPGLLLQRPGIDRCIQRRAHKEPAIRVSAPMTNATVSSHAYSCPQHDTLACSAQV